MALLKRFDKLKSENNTGFGVTSSNSAGRFYDRRGGANVLKKGVNPLERYSWYHTMLEMKTGTFLLLLFSIYIIINLIFACVYSIIGVQFLSGINGGSGLKRFTDVFFFSTQTFTTVGYGRISPVGFLTSAVSTFEAFLGLLSFALATGLFYGRFSRPQAFLKFSHNALISPYKDGIALMLRMSTFKNNKLSEAEAKLTMAMEMEQEGKMINQFFNLDIEISKINALALSWTLVHPIIETSPLYGFGPEDIKNSKMEVFVFVKAFDEVFANTVVGRTSYVSQEIVWGAKFRLMYNPSEDKTKTILDLTRLNRFDFVEVPRPASVS